MPDEDDQQRPAGRATQRMLSQSQSQIQADLRSEQPVRSDPERRRRRESFLADLDEAQHLLERVAPRRTRMAQLRQQQLMRTYMH
jgi:hypothetical protein